MRDSFLVQAYRIQPNPSVQKHFTSFSTKQTSSPSKLSQDKFSEWSTPKKTKRKCALSSCQTYALGILIGALVCGVGLATVLILWLKPNSTSTTSSKTTFTTISSTTVVAASTIPVTASTTTICSISSGTTTTAAPNTTVIFSMNSPCSASPAYFPVVFYYIAQGSNETISFGIQNDPITTYIDDVSVVSNGVELLCNGGFENGTQICWQGANHLQSGGAHTGSYCYGDPVTGSPDYVYQTFQTTPGALLNISFWTAWTGSGSGIITIVTISP